MGYYTEFEFNTKLSKDTPREITELLTRCFDGSLLLEKLNLDSNTDNFCFCVGDQGTLPIEHEFGKCSRWDQLLTGNIHAEIQSRKYYISIKTDLNNYDNEIGKFLDWIKPYIKTRKKRLYLGFKKPEDLPKCYLHLVAGEIEETWEHD